MKLHKEGQLTPMIELNRKEECEEAPSSPRATSPRSESSSRVGSPRSRSESSSRVGSPRSRSSAVANPVPSSSETACVLPPSFDGAQAVASDAVDSVSVAVNIGGAGGGADKVDGVTGAVGILAGASTPMANASDQEDKFGKYRTMLKEMLPQGAVEQKMRQEGVSDSDIALFIAGPLSLPSTPPILVTSAPEQEDKFGKYRTMLKKMLPQGAVELKMRQEGVSDADIALFISTIVTPAPQGGAITSDGRSDAVGVCTSESSVAIEVIQKAEQQRKFEKYMKLSKMGLPEAVVEQKMRKDGVTEADIALFFKRDVGDNEKAPAPEKKMDKKVHDLAFKVQWNS